jgi:hypothetical protein
MGKEEDERIKMVFERAREMKKYGPAQKSLIVELAQKAVLNVLDYYGCDPTAQRINLKRESHRKIIAKSVGKVFESMLIAKGLI